MSSGLTRTVCASTSKVPFPQTQPPHGLAVHFGVARHGSCTASEMVFSLAGGYWLKQYHDEMHEDLRLIKGSMNVLGAPESPEEEAPDEDL